MIRLMLSLVAALSLLGSVSFADVNSDTAAFMAQIQPRMAKIQAMPQGEARAANSVLIMSDILGFLANLGNQIPTLSSSSGSLAVNIQQAEVVYNTYKSWTNPQVAGQVAILKTTLMELEGASQDLAKACQNLEAQLQPFSTAIAGLNAKVQEKYGQTRVSPISNKVTDLGQTLGTGYATLASLYTNYSVKISQLLADIDADQDPSDLVYQLMSLELQIQAFQPASGYTFTQMAQEFAQSSAVIRSQYPDMN